MIMNDKVLVVDDVDDVRTSMQMVLEKSGYLVRAAEDGPSALREAHSFQPDLVLLDIMMPGMDGVAVCRRLREVSDIPIIMLTAINDEAMLIKALRSGADGYVVKGIGMDELRARVRSAIRRARSSPVELPGESYADMAIEIDYKRQLVWVRGAQVGLPAKEYGLLTVLVQRRGNPVSVPEIIDAVWGSDRDPEIVKRLIKQLRRKIEEDPDRPKSITTRRGYGYTYNAPGRRA